MRKWLLVLLCLCCVSGTLTMVGCSESAEEPGTEGVKEAPPEELNPELLEKPPSDEKKEAPQEE